MALGHTIAEGEKGGEIPAFKIPRNIKYPEISGM